MDEELVTVAVYPDAITAEIAKNFLADSGVTAFAAEEGQATVFSGVEAMTGGVKLQVAEADVQRARELLLHHESLAEDEPIGPGEAAAEE